MIKANVWIYCKYHFANCPTSGKQILSHYNTIILIQIRHAVFDCKVRNQKRHVIVDFFGCLLIIGYGRTWAKTTGQSDFFRTMLLTRHNDILNYSLSKHIHQHTRFHGQSGPISLKKRLQTRTPRDAPNP